MLPLFCPNFRDRSDPARAADKLALSRPDDLSSVAEKVKHSLKGFGLEQRRHRRSHIEFTFLEWTVRKRRSVEVAGRPRPFI